MEVWVEFDVTHGPVTTFGIGRGFDNSYQFITSEETVVPGPLHAIENTTSRVDLSGDPSIWVDHRSHTDIGRRWALFLGRRAADLRARRQPSVSKTDMWRSASPSWPEAPRPKARRQNPVQRAPPALDLSLIHI